MTEEELVRTATRLGERQVENLDAERLAREVLARLRTEPVVAETRFPRRRGWLIGLASAATVLLVLRLSLGGPGTPQPGPGEAAPALTVLHELDDLTDAELEVLLETLPPVADSAVHPDAASLHELDEKSLERLLRSLEG